MKLRKKPGKIFFGLIYVIGSFIIFYLVFWNWKPDIVELLTTDFNRLIDERLVLISTIFIIPSVLILKGKKVIPIKFAVTFSGLWVLMFLIVIIISTVSAQGMAEWLKNITKPLLFIAIASMLVWSWVEVFKAQESKR